MDRALGACCVPKIMERYEYLSTLGGYLSVSYRCGLGTYYLGTLIAGKGLYLRRAVTTDHSNPLRRDGFNVLLKPQKRLHCCCRSFTKRKHIHIYLKHRKFESGVLHTGC